ncbi:hypothetical protein DINM_022162 [Dirofilaria immitis]|nr:hypothetical protein [Dirofilaria immitis]
MSIVFLAITMNSLGWFDTTATTTTTTMIALATSNHINPEVINALMIESLRNNLVQACDGERITVHCPKNTQIFLENIFYGRLVPSDQLCPRAIAEHQYVVNEDTTCDVAQAHTKILEQCRNKRKCKIVVTPSFLALIHVQILPNIFKYHISVNQILYYCHARTECMVLVNDEHFGETGCESGVHKYLSLIFMCMSDAIFNEAAIKGNLETMNKIIPDLSPRILQKAELTFVKDDEYTFHIKDDPNFEYKAIQKPFLLKMMKMVDSDVMNSLLASGSEELEEEGAFVIATPNDTTLPSGRPFNAFSIIHDIILIMRILKNNKEKVLLCLLLSLLVGLTMLLTACAISGRYRRRTKQKNSKMISSKGTVRTTKPTELSTLMASNHSTSDGMPNGILLGRRSARWWHGEVEGYF